MYIYVDWKQDIKRENDRFLMDEIIKEVKYPPVLAWINDVRLYLKISRISDMATTYGSNIHRWAVYGPPSNSTLKWPKRRTPLESNMKLWRDTIRKVFLGTNRIYSHRLGRFPGKIVQPVLRDMTSFEAVLGQYDDEFLTILEEINLGEDQVWEIITLLKRNDG